MRWIRGVLARWWSSRVPEIEPALANVAQALLDSGRWAEARAKAAERIAESPPPAEEAWLRHVLARALAGEGDAEGARAEYQRGAQCLEGAPIDAAVAAWRAVHLRGAGRVVEAAARDREAIASGLKDSEDSLATTLCRLALAAHQGGRPVECLAHVDEALSLSLSARMASSVHSIGWLGAGSLHDFARAERHARARLEASRDASDARRQLAVTLIDQGRFDEAMRLLDESPPSGVDETRMDCLVRSRLLEIQGRFDDALDFGVLRHAIVGDTVAERRLASGRAMLAARLEAKAGRFEQAWRWLSDRERGLDDRTDLRARAVGAWILAALGRATEARAEIDAVESGVAATSGDIAILCDCLGCVARALAALGRQVEAAGVARRLLSLPLSAVQRPLALRLLGKSLLAQGDADGARRAFDEAARSPVETHDVHRARAGLSEL